jgi:hypothetical protein
MVIKSRSIKPSKYAARIVELQETALAGVDGTHLAQDRLASGGGTLQTR